jgi:hypothetical protein
MYPTFLMLKIPDFFLGGRGGGFAKLLECQDFQSNRYQVRGAHTCYYYYNETMPCLNLSRIHTFTLYNVHPFSSHARLVLKQICKQTNGSIIPHMKFETLCCVMYRDVRTQPMTCRNSAAVYIQNKVV